MAIFNTKHRDTNQKLKIDLSKLRCMKTFSLRTVMSWSSLLAEMVQATLRNAS